MWHHSAPASGRGRCATSTRSARRCSPRAGSRPDPGPKREPHPRAMAATFRLLTAADIGALLPPPAEVLAACETLLRRLGLGEGWAAIGGGVRWSAGYAPDRHASLQAAIGRAGAGNASGGLGALMAADGQQPLAVLDEGALAIARDAATTAIAARTLAAKDAEVITILGCNQ